MSEFLKALRREVAEINKQIDAYEKVAALLPPLRKKKQQLEAVASTYAMIDKAEDDEPQEDEESGDESPFAETLHERDVEEMLEDMVVSDVAVVDEPKPLPEQPRAANPDELFRPQSKVNPAMTAAPAASKPVNGSGATAAALQQQQVLAESGGIKVALFPAQIVGPRGAPLDCSELQACIVAVLTRVMPSMLDDSAVVTQAYRLAGKKTTSGSQSMLAFEVRDLNAKLVSRGIEIVTTKGIGRSIKVLA